MDPQDLKGFVDRFWSHEALPVLQDYIRIPNKSPAFDPDWRAGGHMAAAVALFAAWARPHVASLPGADLDIVQLDDRTPVILICIPGTADGVALLYGHLDKQPEMTGWSDGLGPWTPVLREDRLYGRGGADDGYALFGALGAILAMRAQGVAHPRCVILIEACEESGSYDLPAYVEHLAPRIGQPDLVICLDSGCATYDQLWLTTSLRGMIAGDLDVQVLSEGVHSGDASGVVPSSFRIARSLLSRVEDETSGRIRLEALHVDPPKDRVDDARVAAAALGAAVWTKFPMLDGMRPMDEDPVELILNRTWRPALSVIGADGLPSGGAAGNVLRPFTRLKLSLRIPPTLDAGVALEALAAALVGEPPYGCHVRFNAEKVGAGWHAPPLAGWLARALDQASRDMFGRGVALMGEGGSIPFMGMLGARFPEAQFVITGVLGPHSNAHGPNEFLDLAAARKVTGVVALALKALADHRGSGSGVGEAA